MDASSSIPYRKSANSTTHGGINNDVIIGIEEVAVLANAVVELLAVL